MKILSIRISFHISLIFPTSTILLKIKEIMDVAFDDWLRPSDTKLENH